MIKKMKKIQRTKEWPPLTYLCNHGERERVRESDDNQRERERERSKGEGKCIVMWREGQKVFFGKADERK